MELTSRKPSEGVCRACREPLTRRGKANRSSPLTASLLRVVWEKQLKTHCYECSSEILTGKINTSRAKLDSSSGGSPSEPSDDASPSQENAIRILEDLSSG